jgi:NADPH-dependent glutamate synthase beta subunit-like oxidoreductase
MMGGLGCIIGICLAIASRIFYVYVDPKVEAITDALPGANCGGCGYPGCGANAEAIVAGGSPPDSCVAGSAELAETIAALMGLSVEAKEPDIAAPGCTYSVTEADQKYLYQGIPDCRAAALLSGGMKVCEIGCLGLGTCARACPFDALKINERGLPEVDPEKCTGCGTCERVCPKHIIKLSSVTRRILREYTVDDCTTPCQRACPAGINIREYIRQITLGDYNRAVAVIKERNPFPTVIGRICPRFCEFECRRNLVDEAVAINGLKRFVADYEKANQRVRPFMAPATNRRVAVIGGGIEGLSAAFFMARLGHSPMVLEASDHFGGLLRKAIARERLPMDILDYDIDGLLDMGIKMETRQVAGKNFTVDSLLADNYEAVFLATGGWDSRLAADNPAPAKSPVAGLYLLIDLLKGDGIACGKQAVIAGGGSLAGTAVDLCLKAGAEHVSLLLQEKDAEEAGLDTTLLDKPGVDLVYNASLDRIYGTGRKIDQIEYSDKSSRETRLLPADTVFFASGRFPELVFARKRSADEKDDDTIKDPNAPVTEPVSWVAVPPYKKPLFAEETGILSDNDPVSDMDAAIKAIDAGRRGAVSMHMIMYGDPLSLPESVITRHAVIQTVAFLDSVSPYPRNIMPQRTADEVVRGEELEIGFSEQAARDEAARCLQCGLICYEHR